MATQDLSRKSTASPLTPILYAQCDALSKPVCLFFHNLPLSKDLDIKDRSKHGPISKNSELCGSPAITSVNVAKSWLATNKDNVAALNTALQQGM